jgi:hypothetical protein
LSIFKILAIGISYSSSVAGCYTSCRTVSALPERLLLRREITSSPPALLYFFCDEQDPDNTLFPSSWVPASFLVDRLMLGTMKAVHAFLLCYFHSFHGTDRTRTLQPLRLRCQCLLVLTDECRRRYQRLMRKRLMRKRLMRCWFSQRRTRPGRSGLPDRNVSILRPSFQVIRNDRCERWDSMRMTEYPCRSGQTHRSA